MEATMSKGLQGFQKGNQLGKRFQKGVSLSKEYRKKLIGNKNALGAIRPKEIREKYSEAKKGKKNPMWGKKGEKCPNWKGGKVKQQGYWWIYQPNHLKAVRQYVKQAILVMEKKIGRLLIEKEIVHHIGKKDDDRPEILYLMRNNRQHVNYHTNYRLTYKRWGIIK